MFITYLQDYREEEPEWIAKYLRGEPKMMHQNTFSDFNAQTT